MTNKPANKTNDVDAEIARINAANEAKAAFELFRKELISEASKLGQAAAAGATSLTELAYLFNDAARHGMVTETDARMLYGAYADAHNAAVAAKTVTIGNVTYNVTVDKLLDMDEKSIKTPISLFRTFARPAVVALGLQLFDTVSKIAAGIDREKRIGSIYNCLVAVNRKVSDMAESMALSDKELAKLPFPSDPEIVAWISAKPKVQPAERPFDARLDAVIKELAKLVKKGEEPALRPVYDDLCAIAKRREATPEISTGVPGTTLARVDAGNVTTH